jgi:hypothetical protein
LETPALTLPGLDDKNTWTEFVSPRFSKIHTPTLQGGGSTSCHDLIC